MKRKLVKQGGSVLTVSLPANWIKLHNLQAGDEIDFEEDKHHLIIRPEHKDTENKAEVYVQKPKRLVGRTIFNLYRKGVSEIKIKYDDPIIIKDVQEKLHLLMGFEIAEQGKNFLIIRSILKIDDTQFEQTMRRLFLVTKSLAEETYAAIKEKKYASLEGISELEAVQNKCYMFCSRVINSRPTLFQNPCLMYLLIQRMEDIADDYKYICRYILELDYEKLTISKETLDFFKEINDLLEQLYELYYQFDVEKGGKIISAKKKLIVKGLELIEKVPKKEIRIIHILNNALVKIYEASSPIIGINS